MRACPECGTGNATSATYCGTCGALLAPRVPSDVRKPVTVLFEDIVGSTMLVDGLDPERMRTLMTRYFATSRAVIERHGGTVEKFIGDAVVGVFGVPVAHEDDALRAARAGLELSAAIPSLDDRLAVRVGINTGEVIAGDAAGGQTFVTGEPVNVAARLQTLARPGHVLVGPVTARLLRGHAELRPLGPTRLPGTPGRIEASELVGVSGLGLRASHDVPLVGRSRELRRLNEAYEDAVVERRAHLFTLLGTAGVGKSRLVSEFVGMLDAAPRVLRGRCLAYGDGITYWAVGEAVRAAAGIGEGATSDEARAALRAAVDGDPDADRISSLLAAALGMSAEPAPQTGIAWAIRRFLEVLASDRPLVIVFEDIHWAEPAFLDVLEHVADVSRGYPILILCPARPELFNDRPGWAGGKLNTTTMLLEPLTGEHADRLIDLQPGGPVVPEGLRRRIGEAAEGNPLFVEEMLAMLVDERVLVRDGDTWTMRGDARSVSVPPTIRALLAARLDGLMPDERAIAMGASVAGRVFEGEAAAELVPELVRPGVPAGLVSLVRKEVIRPDRATLTAGDAFKFRHILIRDAAYDALPKAERASLHERFGDWLAGVVGDRVTEHEEILGYHLEQAHDYRVELGLSDEWTETLAERAGHWLGEAGMRARERQDASAAINLLSRATRLVSSASPSFGRYRLGLADAYLFANRFDDAVPILAAVERTPNADATVVAEARLLLLSVRVARETVSTAELRHELASMLWPVRSLRIHRLRVEAFGLAADASQDDGDVGEAMRAQATGLRIARRSGDRKLVATRVLAVASDGIRNPMPLAEVRHLLEEALTVADLAFAERGHVLVNLGIVDAMEGNLDEASALLSQAREIGEQVGIAARPNYDLGVVYSFADDNERAAEQFGLAIEESRRLGLVPDLPWLTTRRARALALAGRDDEALPLAEIALRDASGDIWSRTLAATTLARIEARRGMVAEGVERATEAVRNARERRLELLPYILGSSLEDLAFVLEAAARSEDAHAALREALDLYERKGIVTWSTRVRAQLGVTEAGGVLGSPSSVAPLPGPSR